MKILVTGGTGFIGSRLALDARARGHEIMVAGQLNSDAERARFKELSQAGIGIEQGPLQDADYARRICAGSQVVIHLAAAQHEANVPDEYFFDVNVNGTRALLDASKQAGIERFVYGSTIGVYGESGGQILDENTAPRPLNVYGRSKLAAEEVVKSYGIQLPTSIVRISETYGPGDFRLLKLFRALDRGRFIIVGSGFLAAAIVMEKTLSPLGIQPPLHRRRLDFFRKSFVFSTAKAQRLLGFTATVPFAAGTVEAANWYREQGYLPR
jgi:nucleoside-diphosphate-sugar epimerase